tara:strand:+ start:840 stop:1025 length:186 start_codon:yes stop_codon:yes gene_type:complete
MTDKALLAQYRQDLLHNELEIAELKLNATRHAVARKMVDQALFDALARIAELEKVESECVR